MRENGGGHKERISTGVNVQIGDLINAVPPTGNRIKDYSLLDASRIYENNDLCTIIGLLLAEC